MDATSIITQVARDDEQLNVYPNEKDDVERLKPQKRGFFQSILCCWRRNRTKTNQNGTPIDGSTTPPPLPDQQRYLLPQVRHSDMHKKCMVIDLDETLVHSSFKPIPNADFIVPVEIDGTIHQVYVLKRPYVDEFLRKMGELYECVLFTASLAKYADPVADLLDKWNVFRARLFRESCVYYRGNYIKDLNRLGRDLQKIVIVDNSPASYIFHPDNADYIEQQQQELMQHQHNATTSNSNSSNDKTSFATSMLPHSTTDTLLASSTDTETSVANDALSSIGVLQQNASQTHYSYHTDSIDIVNNVDTSNNHVGDVSVVYINGLPHLTIPLPSRNEKCRFALKPVSHRVGDLIEMLKTEDRGIDRATILNNSGVRIASTCNIESLMDEPFWIHINDQKYKVVPPKRERIQIEDLSKLGDIKALVAQLYEALHVGEYHIEKEHELTTKLEDLKYQIAPLEREKTELSAQAERKTNIMTWVGLGLMSVQFGILARLTWWEYSWDIMEPVTYFVTYGTAMAMYAYYCITKTEYNMPEVKDRQYLISLYKRAKKKNFDVESYNQLKRQIAEIEYDLRRLRDPLNLQLPPHVDRSQQNPPLDAVPPSSALTNEISSTTVKKSGFKIPFLDSKN